MDVAAIRAAISTELYAEPYLTSELSAYGMEAMVDRMTAAVLDALPQN